MKKINKQRNSVLEANINGYATYECKEGPFVEHEIDGILEIKK